MPKNSSRFTGRQITTMVIAACLTLILLPVGAYAATGTVTTIVDAVHKSQKARVTSTGRLVTAPCDTNGCAAVDGSSLRVGDGRGALTVDGSVLPYRLDTAFSTVFYLPDLSHIKLLRPGLKAGSKIMITSITVTPFGFDPSFTVNIAITNNTNPGTNCANANSGGALQWNQITKYPQPLGMTFPSPLVIRDRCAVILNSGGDQANVTVTGYVVP